MSTGGSSSPSTSGGSTQQGGGSLGSLFASLPQQQQQQSEVGSPSQGFQQMNACSVKASMNQPAQQQNPYSGGLGFGAGNAYAQHPPQQVQTPQQMQQNYSSQWATPFSMPQQGQQYQPPQMMNPFAPMGGMGGEHGHCCGDDNQQHGSQLGQALQGISQQTAGSQGPAPQLDIGGSTPFPWSAE